MARFRVPGDDMYINGELRPIVDRQLRSPEEMIAVSALLGHIATEVNVLLDGLVFDEALYRLAASEKRLLSGMLVYNGFRREVTLRPTTESPLSVHFTPKRFYMADGERRSYVNTTFSNDEGEFYSFWLPISDERVVVEPDTFTGLDYEQFAGFMQLIDQIKGELPAEET